MPEFAEVKLDEKAETAWTYHRSLVCGNNALKLQPIPEFSPLIVSSHIKPEDYEAKRGELLDRVHLAATQLKEHYDQVADANPGLIPYWTQETTFETALSGMPPIQRRKFFESYQKYFERCGIDERLELDKNMEHFQPFFPDCYEQLTTEVLDERFGLFGERRQAHVVLGAFISGSLIAMGIASTFLLDKPDYATAALTSSFAYGNSLFFLALNGYMDNKEHREELKDLVRRDMTHRASDADRIISAIKDFS